MATRSSNSIYSQILAAIGELNEKWLNEKGYSWTITAGQQLELADRIVALFTIQRDSGG